MMFFMKNYMLFHFPFEPKKRPAYPQRNTPGAFVKVCIDLGPQMRPQTQLLRRKKEN